jgi:hypothetical protein
MSGSIDGFQSSLRHSGSSNGSSGNFDSFFNGAGGLGDSIGSTEEEFAFLEQKYNTSIFNFSLC